MNSSLVTPDNKWLFDKYNVRGSYYTSYPPAGLWLKDFSSNDYVDAFKESFSNRFAVPLQLYIHFPFCKMQCWYCLCYQIVSNDQSNIGNMVKYLQKELDLLFELFVSNAIAVSFKEIHFGGGSPSYLETREFDSLINKLQSFINFKEVSEIAIEIDPRTINKDNLKYYHEKGINRISFGVQDINPDVQKAINRIQPIELIEELLEMRELFKCVNFDLIYGLPLQTRESFKNTIDKVIELSPDRIDLGIMGYRPDVFKHNRLIEESDIPNLIEIKLMWEDSVMNLTSNGYERIGMDHFAKKTDVLAVAKKNKALFRNPMGYSPGRFHDNISIGPSGMTKISNYYFQNTYSFSNYYSDIDKKKFPVFRGYKLSKDDLMRRDIINQIMTYYYLNYSDIEEKYDIDFNRYFDREIDLLREFVREGILEIFPDRITVTPLGNFFLRNICAMFDNLGKEYRHNKETASC